MKDSGRTEVASIPRSTRDVTSGAKRSPGGSAAGGNRALGPALGAVVAYDTRLIEGARVAKLTPTIAPR